MYYRKQNKTTGATLATLEVLPGFYRSSETSTDIRECFHKQACEGGSAVGTYCAEGYIGPCEEAKRKWLTVSDSEMG